jgi:hypothetical protein
VSATLADPVEEAVRITDAAGAAGVALRVTGGVGVALRCPSASSEVLRRSYADVDTAGRVRQRREITALLTELGYAPDEAFNALHGGRRLFFWDAAQGRQIDVFLDRIEMCHTVDVSQRLDVHARTLPLADLLLAKLQIVETNRKDLLDIVTLLHDHDFTDGEEGLNLSYLAGLAGADWGLWRTTTMIAERAAQFARELDGFDGATRVHDQVRVYLEGLEAAPKTRGFRLRARIGDRKRWYELPEDPR